MQRTTPDAPPSGRCRRNLPDAILHFATLAIAVSALLTVLVMVFAGQTGLRTVSILFSMNLIFSVSIGGLMTFLYSRVFDHLRGPHPTRVRTLLAHLAILVPGISLGGELGLRLIAVAPWLEGIHINRIRTFIIAWVLGIIITLAMTSYEGLRGRMHRSERRAEEMRREALAARLEALQARTNPHFLFNGLNTVAGLIEEDPAKAERVLERFSELLRYSLTGGRRERVRFAEELEMARNYLAVESLRLESRLRTRFEIEAGTESVAVPPLLLQPLVENAVLHGVAPRREGGTVAVHARRRNGSLVVTVEDDGPGPGGSARRGTGTALDGIRKRLRLLYEDRGNLETGERPGGGFRARVTVPATEEPA